MRGSVELLPRGFLIVAPPEGTARLVMAAAAFVVVKGHLARHLRESLASARVEIARGAASRVV